MIINNNKSSNNEKYQKDDIMLNSYLNKNISKNDQKQKLLSHENKNSKHMYNVQRISNFFDSNNKTYKDVSAKNMGNKYSCRIGDENNINKKNESYMNFFKKNVRSVISNITGRLILGRQDVTELMKGSFNNQPEYTNRKEDNKINERKETIGELKKDTNNIIDIQTKNYESYNSNKHITGLRTVSINLDKKENKNFNSTIKNNNKGFPLLKINKITLTNNGKQSKQWNIKDITNNTPKSNNINNSRILNLKKGIDFTKYRSIVSKRTSLIQESIKHNTKRSIQDLIKNKLNENNKPGKDIAGITMKKMNYQFPLTTHNSINQKILDNLKKIPPPNIHTLNRKVKVCSKTINDSKIKSNLNINLKEKKNKPFLLKGLNKNEKIPYKKNPYTPTYMSIRDKKLTRHENLKIIVNDDTFHKNLKKMLIDTIMNPEKGETGDKVSISNKKDSLPFLKRQSSNVTNKSSPINKGLNNLMKNKNPIETKQEMLRRYSTAVRNRNSIIIKSNNTTQYNNTNTSNIVIINDIEDTGNNKNNILVKNKKQIEETILIDEDTQEKGNIQEYKMIDVIDKINSNVDLENLARYKTNKNAFEELIQRSLNIDEKKHVILKNIDKFKDSSVPPLNRIIDKDGGNKSHEINTSINNILKIEKYQDIKEELNDKKTYSETETHTLPLHGINLSNISNLLPNKIIFSSLDKECSVKKIANNLVNKDINKFVPKNEISKAKIQSINASFNEYNEFDEALKETRNYKESVTSKDERYPPLDFDRHYENNSKLINENCVENSIDKNVSNIYRKNQFNDQIGYDNIYNDENFEKNYVIEVNCKKNDSSTFIEDKNAGFNLYSSQKDGQKMEAFDTTYDMNGDIFKNTLTNENYDEVYETYKNGMCAEIETKKINSKICSNETNFVSCDSKNIKVENNNCNNENNLVSSFYKETKCISYLKRNESDQNENNEARKKDVSKDFNCEEKSINNHNILKRGEILSRCKSYDKENNQISNDDENNVIIKDCKYIEMLLKNSEEIEDESKGHNKKIINNSNFIPNDMIPCFEKMGISESNLNGYKNEDNSNQYNELKDGTNNNNSKNNEQNKNLNCVNLKRTSVDKDNDIDEIMTIFKETIIDKIDDKESDICVSNIIGKEDIQKTILPYNENNMNTLYTSTFVSFPKGDKIGKNIINGLLYNKDNKSAHIDEKLKENSFDFEKNINFEKNEEKGTEKLKYEKNCENIGNNHNQANNTKLLKDKNGKKKRRKWECIKKQISYIKTHEGKYLIKDAYTDSKKFGITYCLGSDENETNSVTLLNDGKLLHKNKMCVNFSKPQVGKYCNRNNKIGNKIFSLNKYPNKTILMKKKYIMSNFSFNLKKNYNLSLNNQNVNFFKIKKGKFCDKKNKIDVINLEAQIGSSTKINNSSCYINKNSNICENNNTKKRKIDLPLEKNNKQNYEQVKSKKINSMHSLQACVLSQMNDEIKNSQEMLTSQSVIYKIEDAVTKNQSEKKVEIINLFQSEDSEQNMHTKENAYNKEDANKMTKPSHSDKHENIFNFLQPESDNNLENLYNISSNKEGIFFYEHGWINIILQLINNNNLDLAENLMIFLFQKEEQLYKSFINDESEFVKTYEYIKKGNEENSNLCINNNENNRKKQNMNKKLSSFMQQICMKCPLDWPLLDIGILIIVSQVVCYIFNYNKIHFFFDACRIFEKYCIGILLNSSLICTKKNGSFVFMFEHEFFYQIVISKDYKISKEVIKYHSSYLKNDYFIQEKTILDYIFLALACYITISQNLKDYIENNNIIYYLNFFHKGIDSKEISGAMSDMFPERKLKRRRIKERSESITNKPFRRAISSDTAQYINNDHIIKHSQSESIDKYQNNSEYRNKEKNENKTYEKKVKKRLSILRTVKCIKKLKKIKGINKIEKNHDFEELNNSSQNNDNQVNKNGWVKKSESFDNARSNKENIINCLNKKKRTRYSNIEKNEMNCLFNNRKIDTIVKYHTKTKFEKLLCFIIIEIFNLIYDNRKYTIENILIIRKFFRIFLNYAQKKFISLSIYIYSKKSKKKSLHNPQNHEFKDFIQLEFENATSNLDNLLSKYRHININKSGKDTHNCDLFDKTRNNQSQGCRDDKPMLNQIDTYCYNKESYFGYDFSVEDGNLFIPMPSYIYENYYNMWVWIERIFCENFYQINNMLFNFFSFEKNGINSKKINVDYSKLELINRNIKRFSSLQKRNGFILKEYWNIFGLKKRNNSPSSNSNNNFKNDVKNSSDFLKEDNEFLPGSIHSKKLLPNCYSLEEWSGKNQLFYELEKKDQEYDMLCSYFLSSIHCICKTYLSMEEIPSFLHLKNKNNVILDDTLICLNEMNLSFTKTTMKEDCNVYEQINRTLKFDKDQDKIGQENLLHKESAQNLSENYEKNVLLLNQLKKRLKVYDIQWYEEYEKKYFNLLNCINLLKKQFKKNKLFYKIMKNNISSIWLNKIQIYLQYIQIAINCKFVLGYTYNNIYLFIKKNYSFVITIIEHYMNSQMRGSTVTTTIDKSDKTSKDNGNIDCQVDDRIEEISDSSILDFPIEIGEILIDDNFLLTAWEIANFYFCILYYKFELKTILIEVLKWIHFFEKIGTKYSQELFKFRCSSYILHILILMNKYQTAQNMMKNISHHYIKNVNGNNGDEFQNGEESRVKRCILPYLKKNKMMDNSMENLKNFENFGEETKKGNGNKKGDGSVVENLFPHFEKKKILYSHIINKCYLYNKWVNYMIMKYNKVLIYLLRRNNIVKLILFNKKNVNVLMKSRKEKVLIKDISKHMIKLQNILLFLHYLSIKLYKSYYYHSSILHNITSKQILEASKYLNIKIKNKKIIMNYITSFQNMNAYHNYKPFETNISMNYTPNNSIYLSNLSDLFPSSTLFKSISLNYDNKWINTNASTIPISSNDCIKTDRNDSFICMDSNSQANMPNDNTYTSNSQNNDDMFYLHALILSIQIQYTLSICIILCSDLFIAPRKVNRLIKMKNNVKKKKFKSINFVLSLFSYKLLCKHYRIINGNSYKKRKKKCNNTNNVIRAIENVGEKNNLKPFDEKFINLTNTPNIYNTNYSTQVEANNDNPFNDKKFINNNIEEHYINENNCNEYDNESVIPLQESFQQIDKNKISDYSNNFNLKHENTKERKEYNSDILTDELINDFGKMNDINYLSDFVPGKYENYKKIILKKNNYNNIYENLSILRKNKIKNVITKKNNYHVLVKISTWLSKNSVLQLTWIAEKLFKICLPEMLCVVLGLQANMLVNKNILANVKRIDRIMRLCSESPQLVHFATESLKKYKNKKNCQIYNKYFKIYKKSKKIFLEKKKEINNSEDIMSKLCEYFLKS